MNTVTGHQPEARFSVVEFTTLHLPFAEDLEIYVRAGAAGIGIVEGKLGDDARDLELFRRSGLVATSICPTIGSILPSPSLPGPDEPGERIEAIREAMRRTIPFAPVCFTVVTGPVGGRSPEEAREIARDGLALLAAEADELGTRLALELVHPSLAELFSFPLDIAEGARLLDDSGSATAGLAVDLWHVGGDPDVVARLEGFAPRIATVHVNDRRSPSRSWADRVLPGDGDLGVGAMLAALERGGYAGWYELEIVSDDGTFVEDFEDSLWKRDPLELVSDGRAHVLELLAGV